MKKVIDGIRRAVLFLSKEYNDARIMTNAATITLFMFISIFPLLMIIMMLVPHLYITLDDVLDLFKPAVPDELFQVLQAIFRDIYERSLGGSTLSITIVLALWTASSGISWLVRGINDVYRRNEKRRNWIAHRLLSLLYTLIFVIVIVVTLLFVVFGHNVQEWLVRKFPNVPFWQQQFEFFGNLIALIVIDIFMTIVYQVFPGNQKFLLYQLPGAVFSTFGWYVFSMVYSFYLRTVSNYSYTYGSLATIVSIIIWLFICMNIILIGGEINYLWENFVRGRKRKRQRNYKNKKLYTQQK